jgi:leucyl/phenylalanyl-tRNA---protein transferase
VSRGFGPDELIACYTRGVFPMADGRDDPRLFLVDPDDRGVIPLDAFHVPKRLARTVKSDLYRVTVNSAFRTVIEHRRGQADSIECWLNGQLVGGLYGVRLGSAFFGESMFSLARDASKVALVHLVAHLIACDFKLLDTQFMTAHLQQFGTLEIPRDTYKKLLDEAINSPSIFPAAQLLQEPQYPAAVQAQLGPGARCLLAIAAGVPHHHHPHN